MIQLIRSNTQQSAQSTYIGNIDLASIGAPLVQFTSQQTGNSTTCIAASYGETDRYSKLSFIVAITEPTDFFRTLGVIYLGFEDRQMGFYDDTVYDNNASTSNLDPTGLTTIWKGLMNLTAEQTGAAKYPSVEYTEYVENDSDVEAVYITF